MALVIQTTIRNMREFTQSEWDSEYGSQGDYEALLHCMNRKVPVVVDCEATDGYYDITLPLGRVISAISWYHLDGFTEDGIEGFGG